MLFPPIPGDGEPKSELPLHHVSEELLFCHQELIFKSDENV